MSDAVAVVKWSQHDELAEAISGELLELGYEPLSFQCDESVPESAAVVFSFAPYGDFLRIVHEIARYPAGSRPTLAHWNTEGIPDLRIPWHLMRVISIGRSWLGRLSNTDDVRGRFLVNRSPLARMQTRMLRYRYVGDYYYAYEKGWLTVLADSSAVYARLYNQHGLPAIFAPWGAVPTWYDDNFSRFAMAAPNRSLIVSEPLLPHCPLYEAGTHYVSSPVDTLAQTIVHYLEHEEERQRIVENAYQLVTTQLTFHRSIKRIMDTVEAVRQPASSSNGFDRQLL